MKRFILLTVIAILANVGMAVQIKNIGQHHANFTSQKILSEVEVVAATSQSTLSAKDVRESLETLKAQDIKDGNPQAIFQALKIANELMATVMTDNMQSLSQGLKTVASISKILSYGMPFAAVALDLFITAQPNPELEAIKNQISDLSKKVEENHSKTIAAIDEVKADICWTEILQYRTKLRSMIDYHDKAQKNYKKVQGTTNVGLYPFADIESICGLSLNVCQNAFVSLVGHFPECLDKIIIAKKFTGGLNNLQVAGDRTQIQKIIDGIQSLIAISHKSLVTLKGHVEANKAKQTSFSDQQLLNIMTFSDIIDDKLDTFYEEINQRQSKLTEYAIIDWAALKFGQKGVAGYFVAPDGYAIVGLYKHNGQQLIDLTKVLVGKGVLAHGHYWYSQEFRSKLKTTHDPNSPHQERSPQCGSNHVLRGFYTDPKKVQVLNHRQYQWEYLNEQWLEDIEYGLCISADMQYHKDGWQYFDEVCETQKIDWFANYKWVVCQNPGEYLSGFTHEIGGRIGFDGVTHIFCCRPLLLPLKDQPEPVVKKD